MAAWAATTASASGRPTEHIQGDRVGAVHRDQAGELVPASDQGEAAGRPGQQRPHLVGVGGVVQHDQHPSVGEEASVEPDQGVVGQRAPLGHHAERIE